MGRWTCSKHRLRGTLLAEALLGGFLIAVVMGVLAAGIQSWERMSSRAKGRTGAKLVAAEEMERCLSAEYSQLDSLDTGGAPLIQSIERRLDKTKLISEYEIHVNVKQIPDKELKRIEVKVLFGDKKSQEVKLHSVVHGG